MSLIKGIPDVEPLDFTYVTDEQMVSMSITLHLNSKEEYEQFEAELNRRGLKEKRDYFQKHFIFIGRDDKEKKKEMELFLDNL